LYELPETLDETYERILMEIRKCNRDIARRLLQCLTVAIRPLRVEELAAVAAVNFDSLLESVEPIPKFFTDWLSDPECVISICSSLVTITDIDGSSVVKFSHPSVKEFLTSSRLAISKGRVSFYHISLEPAHTTLAQACLSVLKDYLDRGRDSIEKIPLVKYAAKHWDDHARFKNVASHIQEGMELLFDPEKPHFANWVRIYDMDNPFGLLQTHLPAHLTRTNATPLYYAALCGLPSLTEHFIAERPMDVDARGGQYVTAIQAALYKRHLPIVRLLIEHGADVNSRDDAGSSLLHVAAQIGDPEAVRLLIDYAADLAAFDSAGSTPLHLASREGNNLVVALLINRGAKVDARDNNNSTPLHHASAKGNDMAVKLLIENRADSTARDKKETPLLDVSHGDAFDVVRLLLDHGAEINAQNDDGQTPLHIASQVGVANLVQYLLTAGADVNVRDYNGKTPLDASPDNKDNCDAAS
jgi:ankyrin repeat protein